MASKIDLSHSWTDFEAELASAQALVLKARDELISDYAKGRLKALCELFTFPSDVAELVDEYTGAHPVIPHAGLEILENPKSFLSLLPVHKRHAILYLCKDKNNQEALSQMRKAAARIDGLIKNPYKREVSFVVKMSAFRAQDLEHRQKLFSEPLMEIMGRKFPKSTQELHLLFLPYLNTRQISDYIIELVQNPAWNRTEIISRIEVILECRQFIKEEAPEHTSRAAIWIARVLLKDKEDEEINDLIEKLLPNYMQMVFMDVSERFQLAREACTLPDGYKLANRFIHGGEIEQAWKDEALVNAARYESELSIRFLLSLGITKKYQLLALEKAKWREDPQKSQIIKLLQEHSYNPPLVCTIQ